MILPALFFYLFAGICVASAFMVIASKNPVHSVLYLILAFVNASGLFVMMGAEFLAMILIVVYVGAVAVLFLFVVMMLDVDFAELRQGFLQYLPVGGLVGAVFLAELLLVVGALGGALVVPLNALLQHAPQLAQIPRAGIVHRLDKDTSGLLVVAKTLAAQTALVRQLQARSVERIYIALAHGRVAGDGEVEAPIGRDPRQRTRMAVVAGGRAALTHYRPVEALRQAGIAKAKFYNFTPYVGAAILFLCISIPLTRFTDHLLARERRRMQGTAVR